MRNPKVNNILFVPRDVERLIKISGTGKWIHFEVLVK